MSRPILNGIDCDDGRSQVGHQSRKRYSTHRHVPDDANREYLKGHNPAEGSKKRGSGAVKIAVHASPDSSNEQRYMLVGLSIVVSL
jgi:hypothetical protein